MEAFSHFITTDDCTAHSCRRRGRRGCLSRTPTLFFSFFFFPKPLFSPKGNQKRKRQCPAYICEVSCRKWFHPTLPLFALELHQNNKFFRLSDSLLASWSTLASLRAGKAPCSRAAVASGRSFRQGMVLCAQPGICSWLSRACFPASFQALALKYIPARLIKGKKRGVLDDWD